MNDLRDFLNYNDNIPLHEVRRQAAERARALRLELNLPAAFLVWMERYCISQSLDFMHALLGLQLLQIQDIVPNRIRFNDIQQSHARIETDIKIVYLKGWGAAAINHLDGRLEVSAGRNEEFQFYAGQTQSVVQRERQVNRDARQMRLRGFSWHYWMVRNLSQFQTCASEVALIAAIRYAFPVEKVKNASAQGRFNYVFYRDAALMEDRYLSIPVFVNLAFDRVAFVGTAPSQGAARNNPVQPGNLPQPINILQQAEYTKAFRVLLNLFGGVEQLYNEFPDMVSNKYFNNSTWATTSIVENATKKLYSVPALRNAELVVKLGRRPTTIGFAKSEKFLFKCGSMEVIRLNKYDLLGEALFAISVHSIDLGAIGRTMGNTRRSAVLVYSVYYVSRAIQFILNRLGPIRSSLETLHSIVDEYSKTDIYEELQTFRTLIPLAWIWKNPDKVQFTTTIRLSVPFLSSAISTVSSAISTISTVSSAISTVSSVDYDMLDVSVSSLEAIATTELAESTTDYDLHVWEDRVEWNDEDDWDHEPEDEDDDGFEYEDDDNDEGEEIELLRLPFEGLFPEEDVLTDLRLFADTTPWKQAARCLEFAKANGSLFEEEDVITQRESVKNGLKGWSLEIHSANLTRAIRDRGFKPWKGESLQKQRKRAFRSKFTTTNPPGVNAISIICTICGFSELKTVTNGTCRHGKESAIQMPACFERASIGIHFVLKVEGVDYNFPQQSLYYMWLEDLSGKARDGPLGRIVLHEFQILDSIKAFAASRPEQVCVEFLEAIDNTKVIKIVNVLKMFLTRSVGLGNELVPRPPLFLLLGYKGFIYNRYFRTERLEADWIGVGSFRPGRLMPGKRPNVLVHCLVVGTLEDGLDYGSHEYNGDLAGFPQCLV